MKRISSFFVLATIAAALTFAGVTPDRDKSEKEAKKSNNTECVTAVAQTGCEGDEVVLTAGQEKAAGCEGSAATLTAGQEKAAGCEGSAATLTAGQEKAAGCEGSAATLTAGQNSAEACCKSQTSTATAGNSGCSEESTGKTTVAERN
ncbi:MAG: hypothetical protein EA408_09145 [Marinilabiliales bacterium]|nr:MAG: hypothetical protein EA408_09145 [Marinilabiliales bacterium]